MINGTTALEVNRTYWHCDPRYYPDGPINDSQIRTTTNYAKKIIALKELHMPLIEVWEADLRKNFIDTLRNALGGICS